MMQDSEGKSPTKRPPRGAEKRPPRGLSFEERAGKSKPHLARWRDPDGRKHSKAFGSESDRWKFADAWELRKKRFGEAAEIVDPRRVETWRIFSELTGGADPIEVARFWIANRGKAGGTTRLASAVELYRAARTGAGLAADTIGHTDKHLERLCASLGSREIGKITSADLREWLAALRDPKTGAEFSLYTQKHHQKSVRAFWKWAIAERIANENPTEAVHTARIELGEVTVLAVADAARLFAVNRDNPCIGRLALEAFGGLRFSSAARLVADEIKRLEKGILMPAAKHKLGRRHYVDGYPDNLWQWIDRAPAMCWRINPRIYADMKTEAFRAAGVANPGNVLRHSFCSYHVAKYKDAARTAVLLTHSNPAMLYRHYKGIATEVDGNAYFSILP